MHGTISNGETTERYISKIFFDKLYFSMIREYMIREIPTKYAYMLTGTYGQKIVMNRDPKTSFYPSKYYLGIFESV